MTIEEALAKLQKYCAYQERCHQEVRHKLLRLKIYGEDLEYIISTLIAADFLNETRYAVAYARGKFRMQKWGKEKIRYQLKSRSISERDIKLALDEIDHTTYLKTLSKLLQRKRLTFRHLSVYDQRGRLFKYARDKGFGSEDIQYVLENIPEHL